MFLIGVDCATNPKNVGLACGHLDGGKVVIIHAERGRTWDSIKEAVVGWINDSENSLLAFDAPLGWPRSLSGVLASHEAGCLLSEKSADCMLMRETDRWIHKNIGKKPFSVGADKIARTAHKTLCFLKNLRKKTGRNIPLAWTPGSVEEVSVIEVYPAATLKARGFLPETSYKKQAGKDNRKKIIGDLKEKEKVTLCDGIENMLLQNDDVLDAAVCVLAAADFVREEAARPEKEKLAKKEGWIWVKTTLPAPS